MKKPYRLGLDVGTNSIGWCLLDLASPKEPQTDSLKLEPCAIRAMGVRIFPDGRDSRGEGSLAAERRKARSQRRRRDRLLYRKKRLMQALIRHGLMPTNVKDRKQLQIKDPYVLRAKGVKEKLEPYELGRALFHLCQRRGFKSNRKTGTKSVEEKSEKQATKAGIQKLGERLETGDIATLGTFLHDRRKEFLRERQENSREKWKKGLSVRFRPYTNEKNKKQNLWEFYPSRAMYEEEFEKLWEEQRKHHPQLLHDDAHEKIHHCIFWQRKLIFKKEEIGRCTFETDEPRASKALPINQEFRIRQEIANLRIQFANRSASKPLTFKQQEEIFTKIRRKKSTSFSVIRGQLKLEKEDTFNFEDEKRTKLFGDETGNRLASKEYFGEGWWSFLPEKQNEIVKQILDYETSDEKLIRIAQEEWGLSVTAAKALVDVELPDGYGNLSEKALNKIVPHLRKGKDYSEAKKAEEYEDSIHDGEILDELPYYGIPLKRRVGSGKKDSKKSDEEHYGRIANPTVHIGLNQLRQVVNALIRRYGHPEEIVIEFARELKHSKKERDKIQKQQSEKQKKNNEYRKKLQELFGSNKIPSDGLLRMRLYEELAKKEAHNRRCVYCGKSIGIKQLFESEVEIEHILPFSRTLDDSISNKTLSCSGCNRFKRNRSPYEAFHGEPTWDWNAILHRIENLPHNKKWRFAADAMDRFDNEKGFLARQLNDTRYLSRIAREYLGKICNHHKIYAIPGRLTAMLRGKWKLNRLLNTDNNHKNRDDHRHHAIDAFVVAVTSRSLLQRIASAADAERVRIIEDMSMPKPYSRFDWADMKQRLERIVISHRHDNSVNGKLLDETNYSVLNSGDKHNLASRKPIEDVTDNEIKNHIKDEKIRKEVETIYNDKYQNEKEGRKQALMEYCKSRGIYRLRVTKSRNPKYVHNVTHGNQKQFHKAQETAGNHHIDILDVGEKGWIGVGVSMLDACRNPSAEPWRKYHPDARLVMRVRKGDMLRLQEEEKEKFYVVKQLNIGINSLTLLEHNECRDEKKFKRAFSVLKTMKCRRVYVDFLGKIKDPYPGTDVKHAPATGRLRCTK